MRLIYSVLLLGAKRCHLWEIMIFPSDGFQIIDFIYILNVFFIFFGHRIFVVLTFSYVRHYCLANHFIVLRVGYVYVF